MRHSGNGSNKHRSFLNSWKNTRSVASSGNEQHSASPAAPAVVCSTEKVAADALKRNAQAFSYPKQGFLTKIEYSLLYTMMNHPDIYPAAVISNIMKSEDFTQYLFYHPPSSKNSAEPPLSSYAQLSALLALAAENWPPPSSNASDANAHDDTTTESAPVNVVQVLCQLLIQCVIRHAEKENLDRETEINELFLPFQKVTSDKANRSAVLAVLPAYVGMGASILTGGNPLPFYIGYAVSINAIAQQEKDLANFKHIAATTQRMSNVETTNLLNDTDHDDD
jgi:hypothetical protein